MKSQLQQILKSIISQKWGIDINPKIEVPEDLTHGDYTSNIAMILAKETHTNPIKIAEEIVSELKNQIPELKAKQPHHFTNQKGQSVSEKNPDFSVLQDIDKIETVRPGFINFFISASSLSSELSKLLEDKKADTKAQNKGVIASDSEAILNIKKIATLFGLAMTNNNKKVMVEFAHPNTHKAFHIGHLRNITTGESIVRLLESQGVKVIRANYQGDVGMHIAKALFGLLQIQNLKIPASSAGRKMQNLKDIHEKIEYLGKAYAAGSKEFETSEQAKKEIGEINKKIYSKDPSIWELYQITRQWSLEYFNRIYKRLGTHYDRFYFESETYELGKKYVMEGLKKGIFTKSEGAIIFPGEKFGLHNRVFITGEGNTTYEGKDMGLGKLQFDEYHPDLIIHVVGPEQAEYFKVVFEALSQIFPDTKGKEYHLIYGWVKLKHGKMSSRLGNVVLGEWLIEEAKKEIYNILSKSKSKGNNEGQSAFVPPERDYGETKDLIAETAAIAAVKYSFLKVSTKQEIAFDIEESVNFQGDSGPYLLYTYARCKSVLRKSQIGQISQIGPINPNPEELSILRLLHQFPETVESAAQNYAPNILCKYLYDLAQSFNLFYNKHSILFSDKQKAINYKQKENNHLSLVSYRLSLTNAVAQTLKHGLYLLGINTLERM